MSIETYLLPYIHVLIQKVSIYYYTSMCSYVQFLKYAFICRYLYLGINIFEGLLRDGVNTANWLRAWIYGEVNWIIISEFTT